MAANLETILKNTNSSSSFIFSENLEERPSVVIRTMQASQAAKRGIELVPVDESLKGLERLKFLIAENQRDVKREPIIPTRRTCNSSGFESEYTISLAENGIFITDEEILKVHPIRFLSRSPFARQLTGRVERSYLQMKDDFVWESIFNSLNKELLAIAVTDSGKHVILQQAIKSCVPTCVGMLLLDHGKTPNYQAIKYTSNGANKEKAIKWIEESGLTPHLTTDLSNKENTADVLAKCLEERSSGILEINHPEIGGHVILLDEISRSDNTATIRDSCHGWALTIKLDSLISWIYPFSYFLQVSSSQ